MHSIHTASFDLWISTHTNAHLLKGIPIFFFYFVPDAHMIICRHVSTCTHPQTHIPTTLLAMYHGGLPCCLSNQRMGSFQLHWSEHIIPFPSSPLLNTQIPPPSTTPTTHTRTHTCRLPTHSPGETLLPTVNPKDWCVSLDKMRLCVITRHYTTEPLSNWISPLCQDKHSLYTDTHTHNWLSYRLCATCFCPESNGPSSLRPNPSVTQM